MASFWTIATWSSIVLKGAFRTKEYPMRIKKQTDKRSFFSFGLAMIMKENERKEMSWREELHPRPAPYESAALLTELRQQTFFIEKRWAKKNPATPNYFRL